MLVVGSLTLHTSFMGNCVKQLQKSIPMQKRANKKCDISF